MIANTLSRRGSPKSGPAAGAMALTMPHIANAQAMVLNITDCGRRRGEEFDKNLTPMFEKKTGAKLQRDTGFPFMPKLQASSRRNPVYDVLHADNNEQWAAVEMGLVEPELPQDRIPNMADLSGDAKSDKVAGVVMFTSAIGMGYRKDLVSAPPTSWTDMWAKEHAGKRGACVVSINSLGPAWLTMAALIYGSGPQDLEAAYDAQERIKPVTVVDFTGSMEKMLPGGEVSVGIIHASCVYRNKDANPTLGYAAPREGVMALEQMSLSGYADRMPDQLSGGRQQRVALAHAIVIEPRVLLCGESLGALDKKQRQQMQFELKELQKPLGLATVFVTHSQEEAMAMSDRIAVMNAGRVAQIGTPAEIYNAPKTRFVADFIGDANVLLCRPSQKPEMWKLDGGPPIGPLDGVCGPCTIALRPERIGLTPPASIPPACPARLKA